jgi:hypothetical protein
VEKHGQNHAEHRQALLLARLLLNRDAIYQGIFEISRRFSLVYANTQYLSPPLISDSDAALVLTDIALLSPSGSESEMHVSTCRVGHLQHRTSAPPTLLTTQSLFT